MKTVTQTELAILSNFNFAKSNWNGDDTQTLKIEYDAEYQDFAITTSEKNVRKNRISKLQAEITAWAENQLAQLKYQNKTVTVFNLTYQNDEIGIELVISDTTEPITQ